MRDLVSASTEYQGPITYYISQEVRQLEERCGHARFATIWISIRLMHREYYEQVPFVATKRPLLYLMCLRKRMWCQYNHI